MKVVILNWSQGENDPFTFFSETLARILIRCGKTVEILQITDNTWPEKLRLIEQVQGVEFVFTWQGINTGAVLSDGVTSVWDKIRVPLISLHGDHPCYMPDNHRLDVEHCAHLYVNADFAKYSNVHFRKQNSAMYVQFPQTFFEKKLVKDEERVFNYVKNIRHTQDIESAWKKQLPDEARKAYLQTAEVLKYLVKNEEYFEMHDVMDALIVTEKWAWLTEEMNPGLVHHFHQEMDYYVRSYRSMVAIEELRDFPVNIYGRGWDRYKEGAPKNWDFRDGLDMSDSQSLYYSRYGLIDISPSRSLHDRSMRAMANHCSFLTSARLENSIDHLEPFDSLFFDFRQGDLKAKCEAVMRDPQGHREASIAFSRKFNELFHYEQFVKLLEVLAMQLKARC
jgi:hypothetical protein